MARLFIFLVLFMVGACGNQTEIIQTEIMPPDASDSTPDAVIDPCPPGAQTLYYRDDTGALQRTSLPDGETTPTGVSGGPVSVSEDGEHVVVSADDYSSDLRLVTAGSEIALPGEGLFGIESDGTVITVGEDGLFLTDSAGTIRQLYEGIVGPGFSSAGGRIVFQSLTLAENGFIESRRVHVIRLADGAELLDRPTTGSTSSGPVLSPSGALFVYSDTDVGLTIVDVESGEEVINPDCGLVPADENWVGGGGIGGERFPLAPFAADESSVLTLCDDDLVRLWLGDGKSETVLSPGGPALNLPDGGVVSRIPRAETLDDGEHHATDIWRVLDGVASELQADGRYRAFIDVSDDARFVLFLSEILISNGDKAGISDVQFEALDLAVSTLTSFADYPVTAIAFASDNQTVWYVHGDSRQVSWFRADGCGSGDVLELGATEALAFHSAFAVDR